MMRAAESDVSDEDWEEIDEDERHWREKRRREAARSLRGSRSRPDEPLEQDRRDAVRSMRGSRPDDLLRGQERRDDAPSQYGSRLRHRRSSNASLGSNGENLHLRHSVSVR